VCAAAQRADDFMKTTGRRPQRGKPPSHSQGQPNVSASCLYDNRESKEFQEGFWEKRGNEEIRKRKLVKLRPCLFGTQESQKIFLTLEL